MTGGTEENANVVTGRPGGGERNNDFIHPSQSLFLSVSPMLGFTLSQLQDTMFLCIIFMQIIILQIHVPS